MLKSDISIVISYIIEIGAILYYITFYLNYIVYHRKTRGKPYVIVYKKNTQKKHELKDIEGIKI